MRKTWRPITWSRSENRRSRAFARPRPVKLTSAVYDAVTNSVTLTIKAKLPTQPLQLSLNASAVVDSHGQPIDGNRDGQPGGNFQATFAKAGLNLASASASSAGGR